MKKNKPNKTINTKRLLKINLPTKYNPKSKSKTKQITKSIINTTSQPVYCNTIDEYCLAIERVFKYVDIFDRGTINQWNISRIDNQKILYFLGGVFQKIKQHRWSLGLEHFMAECIKVKKQSTEPDIKQFIKATKIETDKQRDRYQTQQATIQLNKKTIQDKEKRTIRQQFRNQANRGYSRENKNENHSPWVSQDNRYKQLDTIQLKNSNQLDFKHRTVGLRKPYMTLTLDRQELQTQQMQEIIQLPLQQINHTVQPQSIKILQNNHEKQLMQSPSFNYDKENGIAKDSHSNQNTKMIKFNQYNVIAKQRQVDTARIEELNNRMQDYIKKNAERILRSKNILRYL